MRTFLLVALLSFSFHVNAQVVDLTYTGIGSNTADTFDLPWPSWVFEHWVWEDESTQHSALQIVDDYIAHGIPVSAIIIDSPWETDYNTFEWDTTLFEDAQAMIDSLHSRNVKVLLWITGIVNIDVQPLYDHAKDQGYFMKTLPFDNDPAVVNWWKGDGSLIDWFNPDAVTWWKGLMDNMLNMGIDGWKCDGTDFSAIQTPWSDGANSFVSRLDYSHAYYQLHFDYTRDLLGDDCVIHARPVDNYAVADIGGDQVSFSPVETGFAAWVGDQDATFEGLTWALNNMYHSYEMGYLSFGSDIGGYREDDAHQPLGRSKEVFIRWAQLGTFSGLMENGGGGEHRPWMFDQETEDIYRNLVAKRYELMPYLMQHSQSYYANQQSLMQFFNKTDYSYMLGPDYFVAPFLEEGTNITVNFPAGYEWIYMYDNNMVYTGGTSESLTIPYSEYPVFLKGDPLAVEELANALVSTYPNPTSGVLNIKLFELGFDNASLGLIDLSGKLVLSKKLNSSSVEIDVSHLDSGVYFCQIQVDGKSTIKKVVKL
ncbi:MAG: T9SS type A sorting domain-containing protein [Flavobacteriales bacterium]|nr:T9SS type A sorting domain-containing protein [Flavobacteriales bacterium]